MAEKQFFHNNFMISFRNRHHGLQKGLQMGGGATSRAKRGKWGSGGLPPEILRSTPHRVLAGFIRHLRFVNLPIKINSSTAIKDLSKAYFKHSS